MCHLLFPVPALPCLACPVPAMRRGGRGRLARAAYAAHTHCNCTLIVCICLSSACVTRRAGEQTTCGTESLSASAALCMGTRRPAGWLAGWLGGWHWRWRCVDVTAARRTKANTDRRCDKRAAAIGESAASHSCTSRICKAAAAAAAAAVAVRRCRGGVCRSDEGKKRPGRYYTP